MERPLHTQLSGTEVFDLSSAERLALWSLRRLIRREAPRCPSHSAGLAWSFSDDLDRINVAFCDAVGDLNRYGSGGLDVDCCASLLVTADEDLLLRCLDGMQHDRCQSAQRIAALISEPRIRDPFLNAMKALAAALAACGYWLSDLASAEPRSITRATARRTPRSVQLVFA